MKVGDYILTIRGTARILGFGPPDDACYKDVVFVRFDGHKQKDIIWQQEIVHNLETLLK